MDALEVAGYRAHASSAGCAGRINAAIAVLRSHPDHALSVSWGKDSVAMLALATLTGGRRRVVLNARYPNPAERLADMDRVRDAVLHSPIAASIDYHEVDCPGEWEMYERAGEAFAEPEGAGQRAAAAWWRHEFVTRMRAAQERAGAAGVCLGLRQEESRARRLNVATRGVSYTRADGLAVGLPMARLTGRDVWAIHVIQDLPWLGVYDLAPDRETARSGFVWSTGAIGAVARHGGVALWQRAYPVEVAAWFARWPQLRSASYV